MGLESACTAVIAVRAPLLFEVSLVSDFDADLRWTSSSKANVTGDGSRDPAAMTRAAVDRCRGPTSAVSWGSPRWQSLAGQRRDALQILLEDRPQSDDSVGLATARVQRVRRGTFVFEHGARDTIAVEHSHADLVAKLVATCQGLGRCLRCQQSAEFLGCSRLGLRERCAECKCNERGKVKDSHLDSSVGWVGDGRVRFRNS